MKTMFIGVAVILGMMATYNIGSRLGLEEGMSNCTKAVQILNESILFTGCDVREGKPILIVPKKGSKSTFSQDISEDGSIHMEFSVPLSKWNIETGEQIQ